MTTITVSMEWEIGDGFYRITASEEATATQVTETRQYLHDLCREHRQAVRVAVVAYEQREVHQKTAKSHAAWAASELANVEKHKGHPRHSIQDGVARKSAAGRQIAAQEAQAQADAIEVDEGWLPW